MEPNGENSSEDAAFELAPAGKAVAEAATNTTVEYVEKTSWAFVLLMCVHVVRGWEVRLMPAD